MDDLLALMDDDPPEEPEQSMEQNKVPRAGSEPARRTKEAGASRAHPVPAKPPTNSYPSRRPPLSQAVLAEASVDARIGIRMIKRKIGSIDLIDMMASNPYHSPATLVKMPTSSLNNLLQDPSPVIDVATVIGQTNLMTIGIIFTNTGTRISKNGRAFSMIGVGNLVTGPVMTIFLFGDAYSKHCKACVPGTVMALVNPSIIPPKENSRDTSSSLSLSVRDVRQLLPVAQAQDYGICRGVSKSKRPDGRLNEYHCKSHVDTRCGPCCTKHAKQANVKNGKTANDQSFVQKLKQDIPRSNTGIGILTSQNASSCGFQNGPKMTKNSLLSKTPMHMVKGQRPQIQTKIFNDGERKIRNNPYQKKAPVSAAKPSLPVPRHAKGQQLKGNWLSENAAGKLGGKKRALNLDGGRFDGTVMVPKAHKLFRGKSTAGMQQAATNNRENAEDRARTIVDRQKALKQAFRDLSNESAPSVENKLLQRKKAKEAAAKKSTNAFFADMDIDVNAILNKKSRFEQEAQAEEFAKRRKAVDELAKKEEREMKKEAKKNKNNKTSNSKVQREWTCNNCKRTYGIEPKMCKRLGHKVTCKRTIEEAQSLTEQRLQLQDKKVEDGGIKLGAGVEWTNYIRS